MIRISNPRNRPPRRNPGFSRIRGFSLVEAAMTLMLLALSAAFVLPSYWAMMEQRQVETGSAPLAYASSKNAAAANEDAAVDCMGAAADCTGHDAPADPRVAERNANAEKPGTDTGDYPLGEDS